MNPNAKNTDIFQRIPDALRPLCEEPATQLGLEPLPIHIGVLLSGTNDNVSGWVWLCAIGENRLITISRLSFMKDFEMTRTVNTPFGCVALISSPQSKARESIAELTAYTDAEKIRHFRESTLPSDFEDTVVSWSEPGSGRVSLKKGTLFSKTALYFLPSYTEDLSRSLDIPVEELTTTINEIEDFNQAIDTRNWLRSLSPRMATNPGSLLHYRGSFDVIVASAIAYAWRTMNDTTEATDDVLLVEAAAALIVEHLSDSLNVEDIAQVLGVSMSKLSVKFKEQTGNTIGNYALQMRIKWAKELLLGTDLDMAAIAEKVGYRHQSTFAAAFKREVGMPPSSWRMAQIQMKRFASM